MSDPCQVCSPEIPAEAPDFLKYLQRDTNTSIKERSVLLSTPALVQALHVLLAGMLPKCFSCNRLRLLEPNVPLQVVYAATLATFCPAFGTAAVRHVPTSPSAHLNAPESRLQPAKTSYEACSRQQRMGPGGGGQLCHHWHGACEN